MTQEPIDHDDQPVEPKTRRSWPIVKQFAFRFAIVYFVLYAIPFPAVQLLMPFSLLPTEEGAEPIVPVRWMGEITQKTNEYWDVACVYVGEHVFRVDGEIFTGPTGSGDTTVDFIRLALMAVGCLLIAGIWTAIATPLGWRRHNVLAPILIVATRYYLGFTMLSYGWAKVLPAQFPTPFLSRYVQAYGDMSPMGLIWTMMGHSAPYTIFAGAAEVLGGLLLFWRRTRALGAAVVIGVMTNVVLINYCYDVPVKLFSTHLLLMAWLLLALDGRRIINLFVLNRTAAPAPTEPYIGGSVGWIACSVFKLVWIGLVSAVILKGSWIGYEFVQKAREHPLFGIHDVTSFIRDGEEAPKLLTDNTLFDALLLEYIDGGGVHVRRLDRQLVMYAIEVDLEASTLTLSEFGQESPTGDFGLERPSDTTMILRGTWMGSEVEIHLEERDLASMEISRGFNWINEHAHNR